MLNQDTISNTSECTCKTVTHRAPDGVEWQEIDNASMWTRNCPQHSGKEQQLAALEKDRHADCSCRYVWHQAGYYELDEQSQKRCLVHGWS